MNLFPRHGPASVPGYELVPAATVVIFRNDPQGGPPELLMVQRANEMRFAGGAVVFPGGRVDPADRALAQRLAPQAEPEIAASRIAGIRETLEETGLMIATRQRVSADDACKAREIAVRNDALEPVLDHFGWDLDLDALTFFAHWCPDFRKAFDTRFFLADLGSGQVDIAVDATENTRLFWTSASRALEMARQGEISLIFPTLRNMERLAQFASHAEACAQTLAFPPYRMTPRRVHSEGTDWLTIPDDQGYPVLRQRMDTVRRE